MKKTKINFGKDRRRKNWYSPTKPEFQSQLILNQRKMIYEYKIINLGMKSKNINQKVDSYYRILFSKRGDSGPIQYYQKLKQTT